MGSPMGRQGLGEFVSQRPPFPPMAHRAVATQPSVPLRDYPLR